MFSWPPGMNVSSSRAPPPNVTTTTFFAPGKASAELGAKLNKVAPRPMPVADRKKSRRLDDTLSLEIFSRFVNVFRPPAEAQSALASAFPA
jgi:hypothetical protein